ncbi:MAG TPA: hypothetical protein VF756_02995 [Thermoanaerobaculia bacterium]
MFRLSSSISSFLGSTTLLIIFAACGGDPNPPQVSDIHVQPNKTISTEGTASLTVEAAGKALEFKWRAERGTVSSPTAPSVLYTAPSTAGLDTITVEVHGEGGTTLRSTTIEVGRASVTTEETPVEQAVTLTSHHEGQSVKCEELAQGVYARDVTDSIWPVVYVGGRYHPQDEGGKPAAKSNGRWYGTVRFGDCQQPDSAHGQVFHLIIVTTDEHANGVFKRYVEEASRKGSYPGLEELPKSATEQLRVVVTRS